MVDQRSAALARGPQATIRHGGFTRCVRHARGAVTIPVRPTRVWRGAGVRPLRRSPRRGRASDARGQPRGTAPPGADDASCRGLVPSTDPATDPGIR
jgi:hypothetical protein